MPGLRSTVVLRRLLPGLLAATLVPAAAFAALVVAVPGAGASVPAALDTSPPTAGPTTPSLPPISPFPPGPPTNVTATVTPLSVTLSWTASTRGCCPIASYEITYTQAYNDIVWTQRVAGDVTTATITTGIARTKEYHFTVAARDDMGRRSALSNSVVVVTPNTGTGDTSPPSKPGNLVASDANGSTARLTWTGSTDNVGVTGYDVYSFDGLYISRLVATVAGTSHTVPLSVGRNVLYVRARDAAGNLSLTSNFVDVAGLPTSSPPVTPGLCQVTYHNQAQWGGGFVASVTIRNTSTGGAPVDGWTLTFTFPGDQRLTSVWGAQVTQTGALVTAQNVDWTRTIPVGGSVTFGMQGTWGGSNAAPTAFTLNGTGCVVA